MSITHHRNTHVRVLGEEKDARARLVHPTVAHVHVRKDLLNVLGARGVCDVHVAPMVVSQSNLSTLSQEPVVVRDGEEKGLDAGVKVRVKRAVERENERANLRRQMKHGTRMQSVYKCIYDPSQVLIFVCKNEHC